MKIKMLRNSLGSNDGHTTKHYDAGEICEVSEGLGKSFIDDKAAELADEKAVAAAPANKAIGKAPANKAS
ncbi:hypothetical protein [Mesorhizobium sp. BR-1-1-10]|uniref:hypothetical protein n=1 Tax=Mesorhizobium sp. BR-1-1-10 TaxID=2876660 RepID=UPI001CD1619B|nr:hypothetical protein [Mesorhizobium sp. BR-1-1-10]MBZ9975485.1 hypothetical protein [Mesorhizobium sp. BR-1-1-10]